LRIVRESQIPRDPNVPGPVANHLRFKSADERKAISGADEYLEFELLSRPDQAPSTQPLRITTGPVQLNKETGLKEYLCVEFSQCIQSIATDLYQNPRNGEHLVQNRWWICIETLRLLCCVKDIDCAALDKPGASHVEWAIRLIDTRVPVNKREVPEEPHEKDIEELMEFIDGAPTGGGGARQEGVEAPSRLHRSKKKKKAGKEKEVLETSLDFERLSASLADASVNSGSSATTAVGAGGCSASGGSSEIALDAAAAGIVPFTAAELLELAGVAKQCLSEEAVNACKLSPETSRALATTGEDDEAHDDLMSELLSKYRELMDLSQHLELDTKIATVQGLLKVLDELEVASDTTSEEDSLASRALVTVASTFEAKLRGLGMERMVTLGRPFDPELHSMASDPIATKTSRADQVVIEELESGWVCGKALVRPALVEVGP